MLQPTYKSKPVYFIDEGDKRGELCIQKALPSNGDYYYIAFFYRRYRNPLMFVRKRFETIASAQSHLESIAKEKNLLTVSEAIQQGVYKW